MYFEFSLDNIAKLYVLFDIVFKNISQYGLDFAMFLLCLKADTQDATTVMVLGKRAALECRSAMFLYLWTLWLFMFLMGVMMKWKLTFLYLWIVPTLWLIYCAFFQGYSYCFAGQAVCPQHTGPLVRCIQVLTTHRLCHRRSKPPPKSSATVVRSPGGDRGRRGSRLERATWPHRFR